MSAALGVLALALLGADGAPKPAAPWISYEFRVLEMNSVDWREGVYGSLQPVARQGTATIWTASDSVAAALAKKADKVIMAPKVAGLAGSPFHLSTKVARTLVTNLSRDNDATRVSYTPEPERIRDGLVTTIKGRKLDQGVLVSLVLDDTHVTAVHPVYVSGVPSETKPGDRKPVRWELEVPEVSRNELAGEWLIPNNGVLLASLGAYSVADANGKAAVHERLVLVKAEVSTPLAIAAAPRTGSVPRKPGQPPMAAPSAPSRTLPEGLNAEGLPVPLPPLPPEAPAPTARPDSAEPVATPQTKHVPGPEPSQERPQPEKDDSSDHATPEAARRDPAAENEVKKTRFLATDFPAIPPPLPVGWPKNDFPGKPGSHTDSNLTCSCEESQGQAAVPPPPLFESVIPRPLAEPMPIQGPELPRKLEPIPASVPVIGIDDDARRFWFIDPSEMLGHRTHAGDSGPPAQTSSFRIPLNGVDLEIRIVPAHGADAASRGTWRPSGQGDSPKK